MTFDPKCYANHMGPWAVEVGWFSRAVEAVRNGTWAAAEIGAGDGQNAKPYSLTPDGVALFSIQGHIMRGDSKFGGTNSLRLRRDIRAAVEDKAVGAIMILVDSPGGTVAGTDELSQDITAAAAKKPVFAHVEGMAASAAYWAVAGATKITASQTSQVGSIGAFAVLEDLSKATEMAGIRVHVVSSGAMKGAGIPGTPITDGVLAETQEIVDEVAGHFFAAVKGGRSLDAKGMKEITDGRIFGASVAKRLGLIDTIQGRDATLSQVAEKASKKINRTARAEAVIRLVEI